MPTIKKINFTGESQTNLLNQFRLNQPLNTPSKITPNPLQTKQKVTTTEDKKDISNKKILYVSSALALASLGVTTAVAIKNRKINKQLVKLVQETKNSQKAAEELQKGLEEAKNGTKKVSEEVQKQSDELAKKVKELGEWEDGQINGVREDLSQKIDGIVTKVKSPGMEEIFTSPVDLNGMTVNLATPLKGYGKHTKAIEEGLRAESTKRIFGIVDRSGIIPKDDIMIRIPTSEFTGFSSTGGMSIVPREIVGNLGAMINKKQKVSIVVDTPLYLGQVKEDVYYDIVRRKDGLYDYVSSALDKPMATLEHIDTMEIPIYLDKGKVKEKVDVFLARNNEQIVDIDLLVPWLKKDFAKELTEAKKSGKPFELTTNMLTVKYDPEHGINKPTAFVKFDTVFYKSDKFRMNGTLFDGVNKTIYNNDTINAGETERFMYFDKFFYEHLVRNHESSKVPLKADLIIGNDWQTGGISALMKLMPTVERHFGMNPKLADKLYNTPILTIMHNAGLAGSVNHSQPKLLNILFGEHSAIIAKNAWMPQYSNLSSDALNGLVHGHNVNPQTMAAAYSDVITPVSKGYGEEMFSHRGFGGDNHDIFRMRARVHEYDMDYIRFIARKNGLNPEHISQKNLSYRPITNGCDRVNNKLTEKGARELEKKLGLAKGSLRHYEEGEKVLEWHNHNKEVYLNKIKEEIDLARNGGANPMRVAMPEMTNLEGVSKDTMVISYAGRISDQKGFDIYEQAIEEFIERHPQGDFLFYSQGEGSKELIDEYLGMKKRIAQKYGEKTANRIVFSSHFSEKPRYNGCKIMSDFLVMPSWFEPCGLVHKENAAYSGAIAIINKVGGLPSGLENGKNAIFSEYMPKFGKEKEALEYNKKALADAFDKAYDLFQNKEKFAEVLSNSFFANHSWLKIGGPMEEYAQLFTDMKVLKPDVTFHNLI